MTDSPALGYGESAVYARAVLLLLRQMRETNEQLFTEFGVVHNPKARARIKAIDDLLAEIADLGARRIQAAQDGQEAPQ